MRAVLLREFGPPENLVLSEVPDPVAGPGQVLIEVAAASITFIETQVRAGTFALRPPRDLPVILGNGVAGTALGRQVVSTTGGLGGYTERVAVDAEELIDIPAGLAPTDALALLADGRTALGLAEMAKPADGEWVLIEAAGGGVGSLLVQLATAVGARVIGAASSQSKLSVAEQAGATAVVDYRTPDWPEQVRKLTGGAGVDLVFDGVGGDIGKAAFGLLARGGRFCVHGAASGSMTMPDPAEVAERGITVIGLHQFNRTPAQILDLAKTALAEAAAGRLRPTIGQTFPLAEAALAHATIESRAAIGKTLLIA
ncbi:MAG TPA: zinc-binding dehydrogenase [Pseudonocardiaceae bacterium]|nr:zinc-binding dehydrogenase [Pseudonocardiaceae bacterium]